MTSVLPPSSALTELSRTDAARLTACASALTATYLLLIPICKSPGFLTPPQTEPVLAQQVPLTPRHPGQTLRWRPGYFSDPFYPGSLTFPPSFPPSAQHRLPHLQGASLSASASTLPLGTVLPFLCTPLPPGAACPRDTPKGRAGVRAVTEKAPSSSQSGQGGDSRSERSRVRQNLRKPPVLRTQDSAEEGMGVGLNRGFA